MAENLRYPKLQRLFLLLGALGWGASLAFVVLPQEIAVGLLESYGLHPQSPDPLLVYWLRMAGAGFTVIGVLFAAILLRPEKYAVLIPLLAWLHMNVGIVLVGSALSLNIPVFPWMVDAAFCFIVGAGLLFTQRGSAPEQAAKEI